MQSMVRSVHWAGCLAGKDAAFELFEAPTELDRLCPPGPVSVHFPGTKEQVTLKCYPGGPVFASMHPVLNRMPDGSWHMGRSQDVPEGSQVLVCLRLH